MTLKRNERFINTTHQTAWARSLSVMRRGVPERAHRPLQVDGLDNDVICGKRRVDEIQDAVDDAGDPRPVVAALRAVAARSEPGAPPFD